MADITAILSATTSPDANTRQAAEAQLKQAQEQKREQEATRSTPSVVYFPHRAAVALLLF